MADGRDRRGLGRGLAALLGEAGAAAAGEDRLLELPLDRIAPNPDQPRVRLERAALEALAASIAASGVMQPIVVQPDASGDGYELIAGERRWRAARLAGLERIPAVVRRAAGRERLELALIENVVREDLNPIEVAHACALLIEDFGQTQTALAERLGRSRPAVSNLLRLLELPEPVQDLIRLGRLSEGHGRAILMADGAAAQRRLAERVLAQELSVRATESAARSTDGSGQRTVLPTTGGLADEAVVSFGEAFDVPVRVRRRAGGRFVIELSFADEGDLRAALDRLPD